MPIASSRSTHAAAHPRWADLRPPLRRDQASRAAKALVWTLLTAASAGVWLALFWCASALVDLLLTT